MLAPWKRFIQGTFSVFYLALIILTIPLAFDVGGEDCGIAFTFTLTIFYLVMSTIRILSRNTKFRIIGSLLYYLQHIVTPSLLILHLSLFSSNEQPPSSLWISIIQPWKVMIKNATPLFTCLEGFCTLLVIQATGHVMRWLNNKKSDSWMFVQILFSAFFISTSLYFLYRIYTFPVVMDLASATLIGAVLTISTFLGLYGIVSRRGSAIESSLLFSYVVYCLYITFTDFQTSITPTSIMSFLFSTTPSNPASSTTASFFSFFGKQQQQQQQQLTNIESIPPLPPIIVTGYTNMVATIAELVPTGFVTVFDFLKGALSTLTPSVVVSLAYRLFVFYLATRIIPALRDPVATRAATKPHSKSQTTLFVVYAYAPVLIIAVYTNLLMQHFGILGPSVNGTNEQIFTISEAGLWNWIVQHWTNPQLAWQFWGWINMFSTLALYSLELIYGKESSGEVLVENHFKQD